MSNNNQNLSDENTPSPQHVKGINLIGNRRFTGDFSVLLNHDNHNQDFKFRKRQAKKQLTAYLKGHQKYVTGRDPRGNAMYAETPQSFKPIKNK